MYFLGRLNQKHHQIMRKTISKYFQLIIRKSIYFFLMRHAQHCPQTCSTFQQEKFTKSTIMKSSLVETIVRASSLDSSGGEGGLPFFSFSLSATPLLCLLMSLLIELERDSLSSECLSGEIFSVKSLLNGVLGMMSWGSKFFFLQSAKAPSFIVSLREVFSSLKR